MTRTPYKIKLYVSVDMEIGAAAYLAQKGLTMQFNYMNILKLKYLMLVIYCKLVCIGVCGVQLKAQKSALWTFITRSSVDFQ